MIKLLFFRHPFRHVECDVCNGRGRTDGPDEPLVPCEACAPERMALLEELVETTPLDPRFEHYGNFAEPGAGHAEAWGVPRLGTVSFHGNFLNLSAAFGFLATDEDARAWLGRIKANKERNDYRAARGDVLASCGCKTCWPNRDMPRMRRS